MKRLISVNIQLTLIEMLTTLLMYIWIQCDSVHWVFFFNSISIVLNYRTLWSGRKAANCCLTTEPLFAISTHFRRKTNSTVAVAPSTTFDNSEQLECTRCVTYRAMSTFLSHICLFYVAIATIMRTLTMYIFANALDKSPANTSI